MRIAISNIAWSRFQEEDYADLMSSKGIHHLEVAPTKISETPSSLTDGEIIDYKDYWLKKNISIVAMQSLLFGKNELKIFESEENRRMTIDYLKEMIRIASILGSKEMVFGSPKNRIKGKLSKPEADAIAIPFFKEIGDYAHSMNVEFCIEHNAIEYGADYLTTASEALELVKKVNSPGFCFHLDAGCLILSNEDPSIISKYPAYIKHFHISQPMLNALSDADATQLALHQKFAQELKKINYQGYASIEMKEPKDSADPFKTVSESIDIAKKIYG